MEMIKNPCRQCKFLHCRVRCHEEMLNIDFMCSTPQFQFFGYVSEAEMGRYGIILENDTHVTIQFSELDVKYLKGFVGSRELYKYYAGTDYNYRFNLESINKLRELLDTVAVDRKRYYSIRDFFYTLLRYAETVLELKENCLIRKEIVWNSELVV